ncbi:MAG: VC0807 family protein [Mycobacteriaceae bacterium]
MEQIDHEGIARALREHPADKGVTFNVAVTVLENGGGIGLFHLAKGIGRSDVEAYLAGSCAPLLGALAVWVRSRKFSGASAAMFAFVALSAVVTVVVGGTDPKVLLYKDCGFTALVGLLFGLSCVLMPHPVVFYLAQRYGTDGTREGMSALDTMWVAYREFRHGFYQISVIWAAVYLVQAGGTAMIIASTTFSTAYNWHQVLPITAFVVAMALTVMVVRHGQRIGRQAAAAGQENRFT